MLIRLFQQATSRSVGEWLDRRFQRLHRGLLKQPDKHVLTNRLAAQLAMLPPLSRALLSLAKADELCSTLAMLLGLNQIVVANCLKLLYEDKCDGIT